MPSAIARTPDRLDRLIAFFGWLERNLRWIVLIAIGAWVWYLGAIFTTTALLRNSAAAQTFFVNLLAEMQWSGYSILVLIGLGSWYSLRYPTTYRSDASAVSAGKPCNAGITAVLHW